MSLPKSYHNTKEYFKDCLSLFKDYQFLFSIPNTDILVHNSLDHINIDLEDVDVFAEDFDVNLLNDNDFLRDILERLDTLKVEYDKVDDIIEDIAISVSPKKQHEIVRLSDEIMEVCQGVGCSTVVDFGSGLGYLDQILFDKTKYNVLGLECNELYYVNAKKRQRKYHITSLDHVKYIKHRINEDSDKNIEMYLNDKFPRHGKFSIIGLHACADLSVDAVNIFLKMIDAVSLVIMPCCYHKMVEFNGSFINFPLSNTLKEILEEFGGCPFLNVPFLRLAAQPPKQDVELKQLVFSLMTRATLQLYAYQKNKTIKRKKRKAIKIKTLDNEFEAYIQDIRSGYEITDIESPAKSDEVQNTNEFDSDHLRQLWRENTALTLKKAAIFILLQNYFQPIIENFVLYDKLVYLRENGVQNCRFKKIVNENISPRCLALVAVKI